MQCDAGERDRVRRCPAPYARARRLRFGDGSIRRPELAPGARRRLSARARRAYDARAREVMDRLGSRSLLGVPLLRRGQVVGSIVLGRAEVGGFDAAEVAVVESFAEQAVIAIASATT